MNRTETEYRLVGMQSRGVPPKDGDLLGAGRRAVVIVKYFPGDINNG